MPVLKFVQKVQAAFSAVKYRNELKKLLIRRYWQNQKKVKIEGGGVTALFDTSDFLSNMLLWNNEYPLAYEPGTCEILAKLIKNSKLYADVGGCLGIYSILPAMMNPNCKIFYFELDSTIRPLLIRNMKLNKLDEARITIVNAAVGDHDGELEYRPHPYSFLGMVSKESVDIYDLKYSAPMVRLDDYFFQQGTDPDLLKIDLDGYEMLALRGMSRILKQTTPDLLLEVHPSLLLGLGSSASKVCDFLREFNYLFFSMPGSRYTKTPRLTQIFDFNSITVDGTMLFVTAGNRHNIVGNTLELSPFE